MSAERGKRREMARGEKVVPNVWRLRLPLPWPGVPHGNVWAVRAGDGVVLCDTGYAHEDGTRQLEFAMAQVGLELTDIRLLVVTHAHSDHYGLAGPIIDAAGCELWMHPAWEHVLAMAESPDSALDRRLEIARQSGVPRAALERYEKANRGENTGIARAVAPDRELVPGVTVETDVGTFEVHETPGHAPSHVVLHEPDSGLLISGDHILGRISLFFEHGYTPDPVAEFLASLDHVAALDTGLCLPGHGRPIRGVPGKAEANRAEVGEQLDRIRGAFDGEPLTAFETVPALLGPDNLNAAAAAWAMPMSLCYLEHLSRRGELVELEGEDPRRWRPS